MKFILPVLLSAACAHQSQPQKMSARSFDFDVQVSEDLASDCGLGIPTERDVSFSVVKDDALRTIAECLESDGMRGRSVVLTDYGDMIDPSLHADEVAMHLESHGLPDDRIIVVRQPNLDRDDVEVKIVK